MERESARDNLREHVITYLQNVIPARLEQQKILAPDIHILLIMKRILIMLNVTMLGIVTMIHMTTMR